VIKSLEENFTSDKVSTLLVDEKLREKYDKVLKNYSDDIREFEKKLYNKSGIYYSKNKLRDKLFEDFNIDKKLDWNDFFKNITKHLKEEEINLDLSKIVYADLINNKTLKIINDGDFQKNVEEYLTGLNELIQRSEFLNNNFDNYNATSLHKAFSKHNMFEANNRIILNNNQEIKNNDEWKELINNEIDRIESELDIQFRNIENSININNNQEGRKFKDIIFNNKFIINYFNDVENLKRNLWLSYIKEDKDTYNMLNEKVKSYTREIREIYNTAEKSSSKWHDLVDEFNNRFNVPFQLYIDNQSSVLLKDEAPHVLFRIQDQESKKMFNKNQVLKTLSSGEKRALYLLNILFEIENIRRNSDKMLLIFDDITDSFDYKNKYAIIEYLSDISKDKNLDLLLLTHNFDFYRTVSTRLNIDYNRSFMVQKNLENKLIMSRIGFKKNILKHYIKCLRKNDFSDTDTAKVFVACIPFFRNLSELNDNDNLYEYLTKILHIKQDSMDITIKDVWDKINKQYEIGELNYTNGDDLIIDEIFKLSNLIIGNIGDSIDKISLKNKVILSIGIRLKAEKFLISKLEYQTDLEGITSNQTRDLFDLLKDDLSYTEKKIMEKVLIITPENIHLNAFMYEPIIDISDWHLREVYRELLMLH
jgi:ABC-type lipoprotein export system ATPase subunit